MYHRLVVLFFLTVTLAAAEEPKPLELFNGKSLEGWKAEGVTEFSKEGKMEPVWVARDGMISCMVNTRKSFGFLRYEKKEFTDFQLSLDYRLSVKENPKQSICNSGIGIRTVVFDPKKSTATRPSYAGYEIQLLDDMGKKPDKHSTGSLYRYVAPQVNPVKGAPEWNHMEITCNGPKITIVLNGEKIIDTDQTTIPEIANKPLKGYLSLQNHGGQADFKNIRVKELK